MNYILRLLTLVSLVTLSDHGVAATDLLPEEKAGEDLGVMGMPVPSSMPTRPILTDADRITDAELRQFSTDCPKTVEMHAGRQDVFFGKFARAAAEHIVQVLKSKDSLDVYNPKGFCKPTLPLFAKLIEEWIPWMPKAPGTTHDPGTKRLAQRNLSLIQKITALFAYWAAHDPVQSTCIPECGVLDIMKRPGICAPLFYARTRFGYVPFYGIVEQKVGEDLVMKSFPYHISNRTSLGVGVSTKPKENFALIWSHLEERPLHRICLEAVECPNIGYINPLTRRVPVDIRIFQFHGPYGETPFQTRLLSEKARCWESLLDPTNQLELPEALPLPRISELRPEAPGYEDAMRWVNDNLAKKILPLPQTPEEYEDLYDASLDDLAQDWAASTEPEERKKIMDTLVTMGESHRLLDAVTANPPEGASDTWAANKKKKVNAAVKKVRARQLEADFEKQQEALLGDADPGVDRAAVKAEFIARETQARQQIQEANRKAAEDRKIRKAAERAAREPHEAAKASGGAGGGVAVRGFDSARAGAGAGAEVDEARPSSHSPRGTMPWRKVLPFVKQALLERDISVSLDTSGGGSHFRLHLTDSTGASAVSKVTRSHGRDGSRIPTSWAEQTVRQCLSLFGK